MGKVTFCFVYCKTCSSWVKYRAMFVANWQDIWVSSTHLFKFSKLYPRARNYEIMCSQPLTARGMPKVLLPASLTLWGWGFPGRDFRVFRNKTPESSGTRLPWSWPPWGRLPELQPSFSLSAQVLRACLPGVYGLLSCLQGLGRHFV